MAPVRTICFRRRTYRQGAMPILCVHGDECSPKSSNTMHFGAYDMLEHFCKVAFWGHARSARALQHFKSERFISRGSAAAAQHRGTQLHAMRHRRVHNIRERSRSRNATRVELHRQLRVPATASPTEKSLGDIFSHGGFLAAWEQRHGSASAGDAGPRSCKP